MFDTPMIVSVAIVVIIFILITIFVCLKCFRKPERPQSKFNCRSATSGEHMLDNTDIGRPSLTDNIVPVPKLSPFEPLFVHPKNNDVLRRDVANSLIDRSSAPTPTTQILSRFLAQHDDHIHAGVVVCQKNPEKGESETNITVFDKALRPSTVRRITELFEEKEKLCKPTFINIPTDSEGDLLRKIQNSCLNRKLSITQRLSENSGLKFPVDVSSPCWQCKENTRESGYTIYGDTSVFQFIDTIPNGMLTPDLVKEIEGEE